MTDWLIWLGCILGYIFIGGWTAVILYFISIIYQINNLKRRKEIKTNAYVRKFQRRKTYQDASDG